MELPKITETVEIRQVHDNDKWIITKTTRHEVNKEELRAIYKQVKEGFENVNTQIIDIPKQADERMKVLENEHKMLKVRIEAFSEVCGKWEEEPVKETDPDFVVKAG